VYVLLGIVGYDVEYHERDNVRKVLENVSRNGRAFGVHGNRMTNHGQGSYRVPYAMNVKIACHLYNQYVLLSACRHR